MKNAIYLLMICLVGLFLAGCETNPLEPGNSSQLDENVKKAASSAWNANQLVNSTKEIEEITNIYQLLQEEGNEQVPGIGTLKKQAVAIMSKAQFHSRAALSLRKSLADSLLFFEDNKILGIRKALYYNTKNGIARYYEVKYKFLSWQNFTYDSSSVRVDLNFSLEDTLDDVILNLYQQQLFKDNFFVNEIVTDLKVTDHDGNEPTGVELTKTTNYRPDWFLSRLSQFVKLIPDKSGEMRNDFEFKDGTTSFKQVKFYADNTGEFNEKKRDGTVVSGSFNSLEDDGVGSWEELTDYPAGRFVDKVQKSADLTLSLPDSILTIKLVETKYFTSGNVHTDSATIITQEQFGTKNTTLKFHNHKGERGTLYVVENDGGSTLEGNIVAKDGTYLTIKAEYYIDGSGHIHLEVFASEADFKNGAEPIIVADYNFSPDGSGSGTLTFEGKQYEINFDESGKAEIFADGEATTIDLIQ